MFRPAIALLLILATSSPLMAADAPPSVASIKRLLELTEARKLMEGSMEQMDAIIQNGVKQGLQGQKVGAEEQRVLDDMSAKLARIMREDLTWESLEPAYIDMYSRSFTQTEVDGMLKFYESPAGKAVTKKLPLVLQHVVALMQDRMGALMPRIQEVQRESVEKLKALKGK